MLYFNIIPLSADNVPLISQWIKNPRFEKRGFILLNLARPYQKPQIQ